jgi:hypothetical protein
MAGRASTEGRNSLKCSNVDRLRHGNMASGNAYRAVCSVQASIAREIFRLI